MIDKAVIPVAGLGSRLMPITKVLPKEMLPVFNKPVIQYIVEEIHSCNIKNILLVTGKHKSSIMDHLDYFEAARDNKEVRQLDAILKDLNIYSIRQRSPQGLGDAVSYAENFVGEDPFALLLGDNITFNNCLKQILHIYQKYQTSIIAVEELPIEKLKTHGLVIGDKIENDVYEVKQLVEKPRKPLSNLAIIGRYILTSDIFKYIKLTPPGVGGEVQLTDALQKMLKDGNKIIAVKYSGLRYDVGSFETWIKANLSVALKDKRLRPILKEWLLDNVSS